jgi:hypothetical protein
MKQDGASDGAEIADALLDLMASAPDFSIQGFEPELRDRFAAWMTAMRQSLQENKNLSDTHLRAWCEAAEDALYMRIGVYRTVIAGRVALN